MDTLTENLVAPPIGAQRQLKLTVALPSETGRYGESIEVVSTTIRIPDDLDLATIDQVAAKVAEHFAATVDRAITVGGKVDMARAIGERLAAIVKDNGKGQSDYDRRYTGADEKADPTEGHENDEEAAQERRAVEV